jgi:tight adherence protein B
MAQASNGRYSSVANADLGRVYEGLATTLTNQYILTYRSTNTEGGDTTLTVSVRGDSESILTLSPGVEPPAATEPRVAGKPAAAEPAPPFLRDRWGLAIVIILSFAAIFAAALVTFEGKQREERDRELARLMLADKLAGRPGTPAERSRRSLLWIPSGVIRLAERINRWRGYGEVLDEKLERAGVPLSSAEFLSLTFVAALLGAMIGAVFLGHFALVLILAIIAAMAPNSVLAVLARRRFDRLHAQLPDILMILASSIRSGHSFLQALDMAAKEAGEPGSSEFARLVAEVRLGRSVEEAISAMADRIGSDDFKWAVLAINVQREVGGNLAELLDGVAETLRERDTLRRQVDVLSTEGRLSIYILAALPILLALYLARVNPEYIELLFSTSIGRVLLAVAGGLLVVGYLWMKRTVKIDV